MTWYDMAHKVMIETGQRVADSRVTLANVLQWLTEARHLLQSEFGIAKCFERIALSDASTTGEYSLNYAVRTVEECTYSAEATPESFRPVVRMLYDELHTYIDRIEQGQLVSDGLIRVGFRTNVIVVYPYASTGFLRLRYKPHLVPYSASDTAEWSGWGVDPTVKMKQEGPGAEFYPALEGISAYAKMRLAEMIGQNFVQYPAWDRQWQQCRKLVTRGNIGPQADTKLQPSMGGIF